MTNFQTWVLLIVLVGTNVISFSMGRRVSR